MILLTRNFELFFTSDTPAMYQRQWWSIEKTQREVKHVMCLDNDGYIEYMIVMLLTKSVQ